MITEDYVSFEIAKILKEKGFDEKTRDFYRFENNIWIHRNTYEHNYFNLGMPIWENCYSCPTQQMVMKWLREEHNLFIQITVDFSDGIYPMYDVYIVDLARCTFITVNGYDRYLYIKAAEAGIKYCLENLI